MAIYIDISDVCEFLNKHSHVSGIQRVQIEVFRFFYDTKAENVEFIVTSPDPSCVHVIDKARFSDIVQCLDSGLAPQEHYCALVKDIRDTTTDRQIGTGDVIFVSGAFWAASEIIYTLWNARKNGALVGFLCYDIIPITHRDYTTRDVTRTFQASLDTILGLADFALTISHDVKQELDAYNAVLGIDLPVFAVPLAHQMAQQHPVEAVQAAPPPGLSPRYVLFVSTIEPRKNHAYTYEIWKRLTQTLPPEEIPDLVWVGRRGWLVNDLLERVENVDFLDGKIKLLHDISDVELANLYRNCWFTLYPSFAEGWGLPVAESLLFSKPVISSHLTSLPEVGGDFPWYIDPYNITAGYELVLDLIRNPQRVEDAQTHIRTAFTPRLWRDVCQDMMAALEQVTASANAGSLPSLEHLKTCVFSAGLAGTDTGGKVSPATRAALLGLFAAGWYGAEHWGRWMNGLRGTLDLTLSSQKQTDPAQAGREQGARCLVYLKYKVFSGWRGKSLRIVGPNPADTVTLRPLPDTTNVALFEMDLAAGSNRVSLEVDRVESVTTGDPRKFSIGLVAVGFARMSDESQCASLRAEAAANPPATFKGGALLVRRLLHAVSRWLPR